MLNFFKFRKIDESKLPKNPKADILFINKGPYYPIHGAVYLGNACGLPLIFEQTKRGGRFQLNTTVGYMLDHDYYFKLRKV